MGGTSVADAEEVNNKHGAPLQYDPDFNGPIKHRSCTDILCLILFIIFIIGWITVAVFAFKFGNPEKLILPTDSLGNVCGEGKFENRPVLFFFDITKCAKVSTAIKGCQTPQICVEHCPHRNALLSPASIYWEKRLREVPEHVRKEQVLCTYDADTEQKVSVLVENEKCAQYVLQSDPVGTDFHKAVISEVDYPVKNPFIGRCIPLIKSLQQASREFYSNMSAIGVEEKSVEKGKKYLQRVLNLKDVGEKFLEDLKNSWKLIVIGLALAAIISFFWIILMRWLAWIMLWLSIILVLGVLGAGCGYSFFRFSQISEDDASDKSGTKSDRKKTWLILGVVIAVVMLILLLIIIFLRNRIRLAIALVEESSKAVGNIMSSLVFPLIPFILQIGIIAFGLAVSIFISSSTYPRHVVSSMPTECEKKCFPYAEYSDCDNEEDFNKTCLSKCPNAVCGFLKYEANHLINGAQVFNVFGIFWAVFLIVGLEQMVLAGAFAQWYWTFDKKNITTFVVSASFCRTVKYHLGSLAFGSLLIAIVKTIRALLEYIDKKLKKNTDNAAVKCIMCCLKCCFWCLENFIKFINRNAYIMIAIYGKNFCTSAKDAFMLLMRNIARVVVLDKVTDFLLFLGKLTIVAFIGSLSFLFVTGKIKGSHYIAEHLNYVLFPVVVICIGSWIIASSFFSVYSMAVDTVFLCFLEDCEVNDGSQEKPYRMSKNLMKILGKQNTKFVDPDEN